jgi:uncharacterized protein YjbJ (UPF0337 family)
MNWAQIEGNWQQLKGTVKQQWGKLTDSDIDYIAGTISPENATGSQASCATGMA